MNEAEQLLDSIVEEAIRIRFKHPGNRPKGVEYRYCIVCGGEWRVAEVPNHKVITEGSGHHHECPIAKAQRFMEAPRV